VPGRAAVCEGAETSRKQTGASVTAGTRPFFSGKYRWHHEKPLSSCLEREVLFKRKKR